MFCAMFLYCMRPSLAFWFRERRHRADRTTTTKKASHHLVYPCRFTSTPTTVPPRCWPALHSQPSPRRRPACSWGTSSQWATHASRVCVAIYLKSAQSKQRLETYALMKLRMSQSVCEIHPVLHSRPVCQLDLHRCRRQSLIYLEQRHHARPSRARSQRERPRHGHCRCGSWERRPKPVPKFPKRMSFGHVVVGPLRHGYPGRAFSTDTGARLMLISPSNTSFSGSAWL